MKYKISLSISALCFLMAFLLLLTIRARSQEALASRIAPNILRFHVLAESNRAEDQELKIGVKNLILAYVHSQAPAAADKETLSQWLMENQEKIETLSEEWLKSQGCSVPVHLELARDYFPSKSYGDMVFPCGFYDAARITIGQGEGRNWWCVLYPSLCFVDSTRLSPLPPAGNSPPYWPKKTMRRSCRRAGFPPHPPLPVVLSPPVVPAPPMPRPLAVVPTLTAYLSRKFPETLGIPKKKSDSSKIPASGNYFRLRLIAASSCSLILRETVIS